MSQSKSAGAPVAVGLQPSELELRGVHLRQPLILTRLATVGAKQFVYLWKGSPDLNKFLTGRPVCKRPLAQRSVLESIASKQNEVYRTLVRYLLKPKQPTDEPDLAVQLGLDAASSPHDGGQAPEQQSAKSSQRLRCPKKLLAQVPRTAIVLLMEPATKAPAMEATDANYAALFALVDDELTHGTSTK